MRHTNKHNQAYIGMNEQYEWCKAQYKRERVRESRSNANTRIYFEVRAHCSTSPPSHRRISTNSSTQDFPHREPPLRIWANTIWSTQLLSQQNTTSTLRGKAQNQTRSTSHKRDNAQSHNSTIASLLRGIPIQLPQSPLTRGISTSQRNEVYNT